MEPQGLSMILTGAGTGVGRAIALETARHGVKVACAGRRPEPLESVVTEIASAGGAAIAVPADVTQHDQVRAMVQRTLDAFGHIDVLFNNAGSFQAIGSAWEINPETWWRDVSVNLLGTMLCCHEVIPQMIGRGSGLIINMRGGDQIPGGTAYSCSKVAITRFTELLARELDRKDTGVWCVSMGPGFVRTPMTEYQAMSPEGRFWLPGSKEALDAGKTLPPERCAQATVELLRHARAQFNGKHFGATTDIAKVVAELASPRP